MSIQIGTGSVNLNNVTTTRERLILSSTVNSNLVQLRSSCNIVNISLNDYVIGKSNSAFVIRQDNDIYLSLSSYSNEINGDTIVSKGLAVGSNMNVSQSTFVGGRIQSSSALTSNISIFCSDPSTVTTPFFRAIRSNAAPNAIDALAILPNGTIRMQGPIGIGTTNPRESLHVQGNILSLSNIASASMTTAYVQGSGTNQFIRFQDKLRLVADNVEVTGNLSIGGNLAFDRDLALVNLVAQEGMFAKRIYLYDDSPYIPMLEMVYDGPLAQTYLLSSNQASNVGSSNEMMGNSNMVYGTCNVYNLIEYTFHPLTSNVATLSMDTFGRIGLGTRTPDAVLDIAYQDSVHKTNNLFKVNGDNGVSTVITKQSCVGIGTPTVEHCLHVNPPINMGSLSNPLVGLYGPNVPFFATYSNNTPVFHINERGWLSINKSAPVGTHLIDVEGGPVRLPTIETQTIRGYAASCNVDFEQTTLSNIYLINACNVQADEFNTHTIRTNFMYSSNISVVGFRCFSWSNLFSISLSNFWLSGAGALMAESESELQTNHRQEGKLKIVVPTVPSEISRAIYAKGQYSTSIRVHSTDENLGVPYLELSKGSYTGQIYVDSEGNLSFRNSRDDDPRFVIVNGGSNNIMTFGNNTSFKNGDLGIHTLSGPENALDVVGTTRVRTTDLETVLYVGTTGLTRKNVGINTPTPAFPLHVEGEFYASLPSRFNSNLTVGGRIGIGTTTVGSSYASISSPNTFTGPTLTINSSSSGDAFAINNTTSNIMVVKQSGFVGIGTNPTFMLHVGGDLNFDGSLYEKGAKYISSQWTSRPNSDLWFSSNVGIGTTIPNYRLHVQGTSFVSSVATFGSNISTDGTVYAKGSFVSTSDRTLKTNLLPIDDAISKVHKITGYTYDRTDTHRRECGLVAQEVLNILPEVVAKDESDMYTIAYGNMAGLFVQAIKEMQKQINDLKVEVSDLKRART